MRRIIMAWNIVKARIKYKSGIYEAKAYADTSYTVGDKVKCLVVSGQYETWCTILEIVQANVKLRKDIVRTIGTAEKISKEDKSMVDEIFVTVIVESRGYKTRVRATESFPIETLVAYEGTDNNLHVGSVVQCIPAGTVYDNQRGVQVGGFVACVVITDILSRCKGLEANYTTTMSQLKARKKLFEEQAIWEMLAEKDPVAKELFETLKKLKGEH
jgi:hypothetical protein